MKLSKPRFVNRKALAVIYQMLVSGNVPPAICEVDNCYWATNGFVGFAFSKHDFIFNEALFRRKDFASAIKELQNCTVPGRVDGYLLRSGRTIARIVGENLVAYVSKEYLDGFSSDCSIYLSNSPLNPILIKTIYGDPCGLVMPIRTSGDLQ